MVLRGHEFDPALQGGAGSPRPVGRPPSVCLTPRTDRTRPHLSDLPQTQDHVCVGRVAPRGQSCGQDTVTATHPPSCPRPIRMPPPARAPAGSKLPRELSPARTGRPEGVSGARHLRECGGPPVSLSGRLSGTQVFTPGLMLAVSSVPEDRAVCRPAALGPQWSSSPPQPEPDR